MQHKTPSFKKTTIAAAIPATPQKPLATLPDFDTLPGSAFVKQPQILQVVPISASSLWRWIKIGAFPRPIKLSDHCSVWRVQDVRQWMAAQTVAA
ncbi:MAG: AlpA family phage regulatory protein [Rhodoferax sp.]|nr:AlpA family phage regulatory protein [Rhodoferax sp.]